MPNQDLDATWKYHNGTKHSYLSLRAHPHFLDWENKPLLFKIYPTLEVTRLPKDFRQTGVSALSAIASPGIVRQGQEDSESRGHRAASVFLRGCYAQQKVSWG